MCRPGRKSHADLTSSPPSSRLTPAVPPESPPLRAGNWRQGLRSLWDLTRHPTARADDNHATPRRTPRGAGTLSGAVSAVRAQVRFLAYHRIKPHVPPLVRAPVNSFEFQPCGRTPQVEHLTLSRSRRQPVADSQCSSFTAWTTRVSNPVRSPRFRASASIPAWPAAFAIGLLRDIYAFHRYTTHSASLDRIQAGRFPRQGRG